MGKPAEILNAMDRSGLVCSVEDLHATKEDKELREEVLASIADVIQSLNDALSSSAALLQKVREAFPSINE